jgi:prevent-host-death family protein
MPRAFLVLAPNIANVYSYNMEASLSELREHTDNVLRPVMSDGEKVILTKHGQPCAEIIPLQHLDRKAALALLRAIGPLDLPARK